ncbi:zeta toxin family protein [Nocardiopsis halotolerans]|uniref:zeta toxin family protein n=1 Tax=Nocardiopsis halotolerans TaxID=124252 RepID=UPI000369455C|nr:zeta toxin family protein [Nocardiopsis halotolerans]
MNITPDEFERARLSTEENNRIFLEEIAPQHLAGGSSHENPSLVIIGGATGSGKSGITEIISNAFEKRGGAVHINMDDFNPHHPQYTDLRRESPEKSGALLWADGLSWWNKAQDYASHPDRRNDVIIESALRTPDEFENIVQRFRDRGYGSNHAALMGVNEAVSLQGGLHRYVKSVAKYGVGRYVDPEIHNECYAGVERAAKAIDSGELGEVNAVFFQRGGISNTPHQGMSAIERLNKERNTPFSAQESIVFTKTQEQIRNTITRSKNFDPREKRKLFGELDSIDEKAQPLVRPNSFGLLRAARSRAAGTRAITGPAPGLRQNKEPDHGIER